MRASSMPKLSWMTLARGARQLVVQEALLSVERQTWSSITRFRSLYTCKYKMELQHMNLETCLWKLKIYRYITWQWSWRRGHIYPHWLPWQTLEHQVRGRTQPHAELLPGGETVIGQERKRAQVRNRTKWQSVYLFLYMCMYVRTEAFSTLRKTPVDSTTYLAPALPHGISAGFILEWGKELGQSKMKYGYTWQVTQNYYKSLKTYKRDNEQWGIILLE